jgi:cytochrome c biogenesis protein CcmG, thiol:disulfide interchange protein DsbE
MRRLTLPILLSCAAAALLAALAYGVSNQTSNSSIDNLVARGRYPLAPNAHLALPVLGSDRTRTLADFRGRVVLVNIFASWCPPCQTEAPVLEHAEHLLRSDGGTVLGITYQDNALDATSYMHEHHLTYPVLRDVNGTLAHGLGTSLIPESFVINRAGRIEALNRYQITNRWVNQTLPRILEKPT